MKTLFYTLWAFIFCVTFYDIAWLIKYKRVLEDWESNPFVLYMIEIGGLGLAIAFRSFSIAFIFFLMKFCSFRAKVLATTCTSAAHIYLALIYIVAISNSIDWQWTANVFVE